MPYSTYLPEHMGSIELSPPGPFVAGSFAELRLVYTAGTFGIDDTGMLKISWRTTSDMSKPQFTDPKAANYTTVEASNGAKLEVWFDRLNIRPWANTILIRVGRGYLRKGDTITIRMGDRRQGSPGYRLQTNCENKVALRTSVDAFAAYEFAELPVQPCFDLIPGPAASWKAIWPSLAVAGEPFRLALVAEDMWGNPTADARVQLKLKASPLIQGLLESVAIERDTPYVIEGLRADKPGDVQLLVEDASGHDLARANPLRVVAEPPDLRRYWGDLHGQSGETIGMGTAEEYFHFARDKAFIDIVGHQGNDFQITDAFWRELNELTARFDRPGQFVCFPGYEWSGNTGMGGDRNIFYRREGRPIRRSSHILVEGQTSTPAVYTAKDLFEAIKDEDARVIAHVGGRYADIKMAHDGRLERTVEVHSSWGTFEWLLHDAFDMGYRVGVVCHSDDHKGRPGATRPGASTFGAIGGLTCYFMPELTRDGVFETLRTRHHYGTTGTRIFIDLRGSFDQPVERLDEDPKLGLPATAIKTRDIMMGDIVRPGAHKMKLSAEVIGTAPIDRVDVFEGKRLVQTARPFTAADLGRRVRILWQGAEYRGRGRETLWKGNLTVSGNRIVRFEPVNFLNPERKVTETEAGKSLAWTSVTTGNLAGIDLWLEDAKRGSLQVETNIASCTIDLASLTDNAISVDGGGLARMLSVYRLPEADWSRRATIERTIAFSGGADLPVFVRVTQSDGHQAWTSPIYLIS